MTNFAQAFAAFIRAYENNALLQARCAAGENVDLAECVYVRHLVSRASEALAASAMTFGSK
jgi:hypothetical protein